MLAAVLVVGCAGYSSYRAAQIAEQKGEWDQAVLHYLELVDQYPANLAYKAGLLRAKLRSSQEHFDRGKELHSLGVLEAAVREYVQAVQLDPANQYAQVELAKAQEELRRVQGVTSGPESLEDLKQRTRRERPQPPDLNPRSPAPISLSFPKEVQVTDIYRALGKAFGINVQFDPQLRPSRMSVELTDVTAQEALEIVMQSAQHFYKVLSEDTIIIVQDTPQNRRQYEDLVIQTFFLSNAEVKDMMTLLRSLIGAKNIASNDQLNAIVLKDTADTVKVAERIIDTNDKSRGEVVVDVELLQIDTTKMRELGVSLSDYQVTQQLDQDPPLRVSDLEFINQGSWILNLPAFIYDFVKSSTEAQLLASPQVRISDGEQGAVTIGDRVPIPVTTFNTAQTVGGNIVPITSFQYQDIGIRLQLEPRMHHNREVTLNIEVEVASLSGFVEGSGGQQQPIIATRNIQSTIRLKDGETNFLAGLIRDEDSLNDIGFPGLSDIPVIGRLFSKKGQDKRRTDLVLTLTPHIIRTANITEQDLLPIWVGTESNLSFRGGSPRVESEVQGPFDEQDTEEEQERIREMIRQRIQSLPQGLREGVEGEEQAPEGPPGVELVPSGPPADVFGRDEDEEEDEEDEEEPPGARPIALRRSVSGFVPALWDGGPPRARFAGAAAQEPAGVRLSLVPARRALAVGQEVEVLLAAESDVRVSHLPAHLRFDPQRVEVVSVTPGGYLGGAGQAAVLSELTRPGDLALGASRFGDLEGVRGSGVLARIVLRALAPGPVGLRLTRVRALDRKLEPLPLSRGTARLEIVADPSQLPADPAPEGPGRPEQGPERREEASLV
jgi:general secretion pathway protein D